MRAKLPDTMLNRLNPFVLLFAFVLPVSLAADEVKDLKTDRKEAAKSKDKAVESKDEKEPEADKPAVT